MMPFLPESVYPFTTAERPGEVHRFETGGASHRGAVQDDRMKPLTSDEAAVIPLRTDSDIQKRVEQLIGRANVRQLWLLFLDDLDTQLPLLIPIGGLPPYPLDGQTADVLDHVREVMGDVGASSIVVVHERYASSTLSGPDIAWAQSLREGCAGTGITLRAQLLSHRSGVRWIADDDL
jgi:hypothetical protein